MVADTADIRRWSDIRLPTLLMQGADSWPPLPQTMDALAAALPHAERVIFEGQMHFAAVTAPDLVADAIRGFLGSLRS